MSAGAVPSWSAVDVDPNALGHEAALGEVETVDDDGDEAEHAAAGAKKENCVLGHEGIRVMRESVSRGKEGGAEFTPRVEWYGAVVLQYLDADMAGTGIMVLVHSVNDAVH